MASKPKKRKVIRKSPPLSRAMLLPMSATLVRKVSLQNHMALVALRQGHGNIDLAGELLKTMFVAFFLVDPDCSAPRSHDFAQAEAAIKTLIKEAASTDDWRLDEGQCAAIELILALHDQQLAVLPTFQLHRIEGAKQRLTRVLEAGSFPALTLHHPDRCS